MKNNLKLVDGLIPVGQACPFLSDCKFKKSGCPSAERPHAHTFSCGAARLHAMLAEMKSKPVKAVDALQVGVETFVGSGFRAPFNDGDVIISDDDGYSD